MKKKSESRAWESYALKKCFKIMKVFLFILFLSIGQLLAVDSYSQRTKLSLELNHTELLRVLDEIENQTDFYFLFNEKLIDVDRKVSISVKDQDIQAILSQLFDDSNVEYQVVDRKIVLSPKDVFEVQANKDVKGTVKNAEGDPIIGVTIAVKGTTRGTISDVDGNFSLINISPDVTLVFSYIGMEPQEVLVGSETVFDIVMKESAIGLEEVVAIGYGTVKKADLTGAVSVVKADDFKNVTALNVGDAIQGLVAGVNIRSSGGIGSEPTVEIRGLGNFTNNNPLYIIDGLPTSGNRDFNVNDIESIQVLKDASAAAIYGSRAANGVIIIETKKGSAGEMKVNYTGKVSIDNLPMMDLMSRDEWIDITTQAYETAIADGVPDVHAVPDWMDGNTDWNDAVFQTAIVQDHNLSFSGGSKDGRYLVSTNYYDNPGTVYGTSMERYSFRVNTEGKKGIFTIGENLAVSNTFVENQNSVFSKHIDVLRMLPIIPIYNENNPGGYGYGDEATARTFGSNPIATEDLMYNSDENLRLRGNLYATLDIIDGLQYKVNLGYETSQDNHKWLRKVGNFTLNQPYEPSTRYENKGKYVNKLIENTLTYKKQFGKHDINAVVGNSYQSTYYEMIAAQKKNLVQVGDYYFDVIDAGTTDPNAWGNIGESSLISYFGRLNYTFAEKYLLSATFREDGSSKFAPDNKWGFFPSVSAGWRISKENFFNVPWINDLKLRYSHGTLGNVNIGNWDYVAVLNSFPIAVFGADQHLETGMTQIKLVNSDLKWEEQTQENFGLDIAVLENKLQFSAEYFISTTKDVLTPMQILMTTGNDGGNPPVNAASLRNKGFELTGTWRDKKGDFSYSIGGTFTRLRNEVLEFGYGKVEQYTWITKTEIGQPLAMFYTIKTDGLFQSQEEVLAHTNSTGTVIQPNAKPGDIRYVDVNDDGQINNEDRTITGNPWPKFEIGLNGQVSYKNFDFSFAGFGSFGQDVFNGAASWMGGFSDNTNHLSGYKGWTAENPNTKNPRVIYADNRNARGDQDRWIEKGSYFKIRQMTLGYTFDIPKLKQVFDDLRVSVTGQNLVTFTNYSGLDPEFKSPDIWVKGQDDAAYPSPKSVVFSLSFQF
ncbi:TonB-dependent receptor [Mangrovibacterium diazotrophicum]|uniref:TonB-linked SusC/RagA family outer membrane protein n=1 Tax=Mangrovibacterium diazotrophicum TaxID=1261403 RepID=A0A419W2Y0_9BACT|nr:TonB-dependent receptor [Mangrovibacterium diazotrophicum]RKD89832.1 TonB-linked SusC/RagA family outer membrane protein [Mangrovibacterium diazotrophicum]